MTTADGSSISAHFKVISEDGKEDVHRMQQGEGGEGQAVLAFIISIIDTTNNNKEGRKTVLLPRLHN